MGRFEVIFDLVNDMWVALGMQCLIGRRARGGLKCLDEVAGDLRFADVTGRAQILSGANEFFAFVNGEKDDAGGASTASQLFSDSKATYIAQIHVQENNVRIQSRGFLKD